MKRFFANLIYTILVIIGAGALYYIMDDWRWRVGTFTILGLMFLASWLHVSADIEDSKSDTRNST